MHARWAVGEKAVREYAGVRARIVELLMAKDTTRSPQITRLRAKALSELRSSPDRASVVVIDRTRVEDGAFLGRTEDYQAGVDVQDKVQRDAGDLWVSATVLVDAVKGGTTMRAFAVDFDASARPAVTD